MLIDPATLAHGRSAFASSDGNPLLTAKQGRQAWEGMNGHLSRCDTERLALSFPENQGPLSQPHLPSLNDLWVIVKDVVN